MSAKKREKANAFLGSQIISKNLSASVAYIYCLASKISLILMKSVIRNNFFLIPNRNTEELAKFLFQTLCRINTVFLLDINTQAALNMHCSIVMITHIYASFLEG